MANLPDIIMGCVMAVLGGGKVAKECPKPLVLEIAGAISDNSKEHNVPAHLIAAVMRHESGFNPQALGADGLDIGIMQIRRGGAIPMKYARYSDRALQNIRLNVSIGTSYLARMIRQCPKFPLSRYNGKKCAESGYSKTVLAHLWKLRPAKQETILCSSGSYSPAFSSVLGRLKTSPLEALNL